MSTKKKSHYFWLFFYFVISITISITLVTSFRNTRIELKEKQEQYKVNFNNWNN
ncbi:hypothetical protein [Saccharicrinis aurantiacus]|uniref:hypothetical protein n=1 Tax=Saccharicrinis aurantiacus TaxID=1849719 RepID=UPI0015C56FEB|nr:hypothetical protein [Saccharicrinis aurantiacus]